MNDTGGASQFSRSFASHLGGVMSERGIKQQRIVDELGRGKAYVSNRFTGKRAVDTDMIDAVAHLAGVEPADLIAEIAKRMKRPLAIRETDEQRRIREAREEREAQLADDSDGDTPSQEADVTSA